MAYRPDQKVSMVTDEPVGTDVPIGGFVPETILFGFPFTWFTTRPASVSTVVACDTVSSRTLGTITIGGPLEIVTVTAEP